MPRSRLDVLAESRRQRSPRRRVSSELRVLATDGREIIRAGGVWDGSEQRYVACPPDFEHVPHVITLTRDQVAVFEGHVAGTGLAGFLRAMYRGEAKRPRLLMIAGKPGGGKTFCGMLFVQLLALAFPGDGEIAVTVLNTDNRRECIRDLDGTGRPEWIEEASSDGETRNPFRRWITGVRLSWVSARNPKKLRQRGIPWLAVVMNEAQLQPESLYATAQLAPRVRGGIVVPLLNPPTQRGGDWTARLYHGVKDGDAAGEVYDLDNAANVHIDQDFQREAGALVRLASPELARAEVDGVMAASGPLAYPTFDGRPINLATYGKYGDDGKPLDWGGCVGDPPDLGWTDITSEVTASSFGDDGIGADALVLVDFQKTPGVIGNVARLYRVPAPRGGCEICGSKESPAVWCTILHVYRQVAVRGTEIAFSQALVDAGYTGNGYRPDGTRGPKVLLVGDGTGARQSSAHDQRKTGTTSFAAMKADGWKIRPPDYHWKSRIPWNPAVPDSLNQMFVLFERRHILIAPRLKEAVNGFPSLVDSFRNAVKTSRGRLDDVGDFQHGPDGVRYGAWAYLPRPKPAERFETDAAFAAELRSIPTLTR